MTRRIGVLLVLLASLAARSEAAATANLVVMQSGAGAMVTLAWDASPDASVQGYQILYGLAPGQETAVVDAGNVTQAGVPNLADGTTYYFVVRAYDAVGNLSANSNEVSATTPAAAPTTCTDPTATNYGGPLPCVYPPPPPSDTTSPTVAWQQPTSNITVARHTKLTLGVTASDNVGVTKVEFWNGTKLLATVTSAPYVYVWQMPAQKATYTLTAKAYDAAGNPPGVTPGIVVTAR